MADQFNPRPGPSGLPKYSDISDDQGDQEGEEYRESYAQEQHNYEFHSGEEFEELNAMEQMKLLFPGITTMHDYYEAHHDYKEYLESETRSAQHQEIVARHQGGISLSGDEHKSIPATTTMASFNVELDKLICHQSEIFEREKRHRETLEHSQIGVRYQSSSSSFRREDPPSQPSTSRMKQYYDDLYQYKVQLEKAPEPPRQPQHYERQGASYQGSELQSQIMFPEMEQARASYPSTSRVREVYEDRQHYEEQERAEQRKRSYPIEYQGKLAQHQSGLQSQSKVRRMDDQPSFPGSSRMTEHYEETQRYEEQQQRTLYQSHLQSIEPQKVPQHSTDQSHRELVKMTGEYQSLNPGPSRLDTYYAENLRCQKEKRRREYPEQSEDESVMAISSSSNYSDSLTMSSDRESVGNVSRRQQNVASTERSRQLTPLHLCSICKPPLEYTKTMPTPQAFECAYVYANIVKRTNPSDWKPETVVYAAAEALSSYDPSRQRLPQDQAEILFINTVYSILPLEDSVPHITNVRLRRSYISMNVDINNRPDLPSNIMDTIVSQTFEGAVILLRIWGFSRRVRTNYIPLQMPVYVLIAIVTMGKVDDTEDLDIICETIDSEMDKKIKLRIDIVEALWEYFKEFVNDANVMDIYCSWVMAIDDSAFQTRERIYFKPFVGFPNAFIIKTAINEHPRFNWLLLERKFPKETDALILVLSVFRETNMLGYAKHRLNLRENMLYCHLYYVAVHLSFPALDIPRYMENSTHPNPETRKELDNMISDYKTVVRDPENIPMDLTTTSTSQLIDEAKR